MEVLEIIKNICGKANLPLQQRTKVAEWKSWYSGKVKRFHRYTIYNGKKAVPMERLTLGMPKKVCEDWASLLMNEKTDIVLADEEAQRKLNVILEDNKFWKKANGAVEKYMALGQGAIVEGVKDLEYNENGDVTNYGKVMIQFINGEKVYPISYENDDIVECAFVNENPDCTMISIHIKNKDTGNYEIHNIKCKVNQDSRDLYYNEETDHIIFDTKSKTAWFQYLKPNIENNIDINSPLGISIFANAVDILRSIDMTYDCLYNELNLGRKRIFIATRALDVDPVTGDTKPVFDQNDVEYYALPEADDGKNIITDNTQQLRVDAIDKALQRQLNLLSTKCGFGQNQYKFDSGSVSTATQVVSENSDEFRNLKKHEIVLEEALINMTKAIIEISNNFTSEGISTDANKIEIQFDDSIIEDKESEKESDRIDLERGIISRAEYRAKYYSEDLDTAKDMIKEIAKQNNNQIISDLLAMRNDISRETALELNPYIDDAKAELKRIDQESSISLLDIPEEE